jgi:hypothetical protein
MISFPFPRNPDFIIISCPETSEDTKKVEVILKPNDTFIISVGLISSNLSAFQLVAKKTKTNPKTEEANNYSVFLSLPEISTESPNITKKEELMPSVDSLKFQRKFRGIHEEKKEFYEFSELLKINEIAANQLYNFIVENGNLNNKLILRNEPDGIYFGNKKDPSEEYIGVKIFENAKHELYIGFFKNNKFHKKGILYNQAKRCVTYNGEYSYGFMHGKGKIIKNKFRLLYERKR